MCLNVKQNINTTNSLIHDIINFSPDFFIFTAKTTRRHSPNCYLFLWKKDQHSLLFMSYCRRSVNFMQKTLRACKKTVRYIWDKVIFSLCYKFIFVSQYFYSLATWTNEIFSDVFSYLFVCKLTALRHNTAEIIYK